MRWESSFTMQLSRCILVLVILVILALIIYLFGPFNITKGDLNDTSIESYLSDVGVGALAGILAIVVSVTLMAIQHISHEYTHRIMKLYTRSIWLVLLIEAYIITILLNSFMLYGIEDLNDPLSITMLEISVVYTMLCFVLLVPYLIFIMILLNPDSIIWKLLLQVDKKFVEANKDEDPPLPPERDNPALPVVGIIEKAMKSNDQSTICSGMKKMYNRYEQLINKENVPQFRIREIISLFKIPTKRSPNRVLYRKISIPFCKISDCWTCVGRKKTLNTIKNKIFSAKSNYGKASEERVNFLSRYFLHHFSNMANSAMKNSDNNTIRMIVDYFEKMANLSKSKGMTDHAIANPIIEAHYELAKNFAKEKSIDATKYTVKKFVKVVKILEKTKDDKLVNIGVICSKEKELNVATTAVLEGFDEICDGMVIICFNAINNNQKNTTVTGVQKMKDLASKSDSEEARDRAIVMASQVILKAGYPELKYVSAELGTYLSEKISRGLNVSTLGNGYLFSIGVELEEKLNIGFIPEPLKKGIIETTGFTLSRDATITKVKENNWVITDKEKFIVWKEDGKLNIYKKVYCKFTVQKDEPDEIVLEIKSCCIKTITGDSTMQQYYKKIREQSCVSPVCRITFSYLTAGIKQITGKEVEPKFLGYNENDGFCTLSFMTTHKP